MRHSEFGIFEEVFDDWKGYLPLLRLHGSDTQAAVANVQKCCRKVPNPFPDICRLLSDRNWRPHLVAAVALIISDYQIDAVNLLWRQIDRGSWVTPQLCVALFLIDPNFASQSRIRLESGCPIDTSDLISMTPLERHSAAGPAGSSARSGKMAATFMCLLKLATPEPEWLQGLISSEKTRELLAQDVDTSAEIADEWLKRIKEITEARQ